MEGLRARGALEVDITWRDGSLGQVASRQRPHGLVRVRAAPAAFVAPQI
ncbi:MAG: hypothetical protein ACLQM8_21385 [Limisphaerales bacterium]